MTQFVYDAGVLVAAERGDRETWSDHNFRLRSGVRPLVPALVVAQVSRSTTQAQLRRFLAGCRVVAFGEREAHAAGRLLGIARTADVPDAAVVVAALDSESSVIVTSDARDIRRLVGASGYDIDVEAV